MACAQPWKMKNPHFNQFGYHDFWKQFIEVPCGWCLNCRVDRQNWLTDACNYEQKKYNYICAFVTFTYDDNHIVPLLNTNNNDFLEYYNENDEPEIYKYNTNKIPQYSLCREDCRKFLKRVRSKINYLYNKNKIKTVDLCRKDFKVIYSGEYGDSLGRPHYHFVFFGLDWQFCQDLFQECWQNGLIDCKPVTSGCFEYVTKYITKQCKGKQAKEIYDDQGLERPFCVHSIGLGKGIILDQYDYILKHNLCYRTINDTDRPIPIYYRNVLIHKRPELDYSITARNMLAAGITPDINNFYKSNKGQSIRYSLKKMNQFRHDQALIRHRELEDRLQKKNIPYEPLNDYLVESFDTLPLVYKALNYTVVDGEVIPF